MTTKEFLRRSNEFQHLDYAAAHYIDSSESIYKCTDLCMNVKRVFYTRSLYITDIIETDLLIIERYPLHQFSIDLKYFIAFFNRCSVYQKSVLRSNPNLVHLFAVVGESHK